MIVGGCVLIVLSDLGAVLRANDRLDVVLTTLNERRFQHRQSLE